MLRANASRVEFVSGREQLARVETRCRGARGQSDDGPTAVMVGSTVVPVGSAAVPLGPTYVPGNPTYFPGGPTYVPGAPTFVPGGSTRAPGFLPFGLQPSQVSGRSDQEAPNQASGSPSQIA